MEIPTTEFSNASNLSFSRSTSSVQRSLFDFPDSPSSSPSSHITISEDSPNEARYSDLSTHKNNGVVYTPQPLADYLASSMLSYYHFSSDHVSILDPAIGDGQLVISLIQCIKLHCSCKISVVGFDLDPIAIKNANQRISSSFPDVDLQIFNSDFIDYALSTNSHKFDFIIANPPYVRTQILGSQKSQLISNLLNIKGKIDIYYAFLVLSPKLLNQTGVAGYITSNKFMTIKSGLSVRKYLFKNSQLLQITDFGDTKIFDAAVLPCITLFKQGETTADSVKFTSIYENNNLESDFQNPADLFDVIHQNCVFKDKTGKIFKIKIGTLAAESETDTWTITDDDSNKWFKKIKNATKFQLKDISKVKVGIKTTADPIFIMQSWDNPDTLPELARPLITHRNAGSIKPSSEPNWIVIYPHEQSGKKTVAVDLEKYPLTKKYLEENREKLESRKYLKKANRNWFEIWVPQKANLWKKPKIVFRDISEAPMFWLDTTGSIVNGDCYWIDFNDNVPFDLILLTLAVSNSKFIEKFYDAAFNTKLYSGKRRYMSQYVEQFPIPDPELIESKRAIAIVRSILNSDDEKTISSLRIELDTVIDQIFSDTL